MTTWRDRVIDMSDAEAVEFCAQCRLEAGIGFRDDWVELIVAVGKSMMAMQAKKVELLEGRDYGIKKAFTSISSPEESSVVPG